MNRSYVYFVYDVRTTMTDFVASFAVREHAERYAKETFGEHGVVLDRRTHDSGKMWDGAPWSDSLGKWRDR